MSDSELDIITKQAQIFDLISSLPEGYNTQVGSRGTALSGGQKQLLAIAREIAVNKEILLLDEATSALDSESVGLVHEALKQAGENKSIIAIAHVSAADAWVSGGNWLTTFVAFVDDSACRCYIRPQGWEGRQKWHARGTGEVEGAVFPYGRSMSNPCSWT
jgi:ABC-type phosphate transport system ATPase subunit